MASQSFKEPPRRNLDPGVKTSLAEATETAKADESARLALHSERTARLRAARLAKVSEEES